MTMSLDGETEAVRRSSPETTLFLQQLGVRAPEPRHDPEWRSLPPAAQAKGA